MDGQKHRPTPSVSSRRGRGLAAVSIAALLLAVVLVLFARVPGSAATPRATAGVVVAGAWSNGALNATFSGTFPSATVDLPNGTPSGLSVTITGVNEISPNGTPVRWADLSDAQWTITNASNATVWAVEYSAPLSLGPNEQGGVSASANTTMAVSFALAGSNDPANRSYVAISYTLDDWSWTNPADLLAFNFTLAATTPATEHLFDAAPNSGGEIDAVSNSTGSVSEYFQGASTATGSNSSSGTQYLSAEPTVQSSTESVALALRFVGLSNYSTLAYSARLGVSLSAPISVPPAMVLGQIPPYQYILVGFGAVGASVVAAVAIFRARRRPWSLFNRSAVA